MYRYRKINRQIDKDSNGRKRREKLQKGEKEKNIKLIMV